ncbi:Lipase (class 3) [Leishmania donovani]|nr:Lipase (class 3) [Leishmania donovani]
MSASASASSEDDATAGSVTTTPAHGDCSTAPPSASADAVPSSDFLQYLTEKAVALKLFREGQPQRAATRASDSTAAAADSTKTLPHTCEAEPHDAVGLPTVVAANRPCTPPPAWATTLPSSISDKIPFNTFLSHLALPGVRTGAERMTDSPTPMQDGGLGRGAEGADSTRAVPENRAPSSTSSPPHVHQLRSRQFFLPALCEVCKQTVLKAKMWPQPQPQQAMLTTLQSGTASSPPFALLSFLASPTTPSEAACSLLPATATPSSSSTFSSAVAAVAAAPSQPFLGFGTEGYRCNICGLVLHIHCLAKMRLVHECEVLAPVAHQMPSTLPTSALSSPSTSALTTSAAVETGTTLSSMVSGPFSWDRAKAMLVSYLDPDDSANNLRDANAKAVLRGVYALLDTIIARYPTLTPLTFLKRYSTMQDLSNAHQALYAACVASLDDTALLGSISWDEVRLHWPAQTGVAATTCSTPAFAALRPLRVDKSVLENLKTSVRGAGVKGFFSSPFLRKGAATPMMAQRAASDDNDDDVASSTWPLAHYPVQLLLWQAMRYATAVYGEVYRRGSLSSTFSVALLFTIKRSGAEISKQENDSAVTSLLELPPSALRLSRWASQATEPSYALLVDDVAGRIVVSFRGTLNTFDIMTDLAAVSQPFCGGYAHQGAAEVVNTLFDQRASRYGERVEQQRKAAAAATAVEAVTDATPTTAEDAARRVNMRATATPSSPAKRVVGVEEQTSLSATGSETDDISAPEATKEPVMVALEPYALQPLDTPDGLLDGLEQLAAEHPSYSILITGHSLGGGVAVLFATRLHYDEVLPPAVLKRIHVIAFAPMPTLSLPAASCFDQVSCARADGGYSRRDVPQQSAPAGACFPVWSVVNGFDCVPRLQVNTIDRLLRQVVGPQIAASAEVSSAAAPAATDARQQALRDLREHDTATYGVASGAHAETEMVDMPTAPTKATATEVPLPCVHDNTIPRAVDDTVEDGANTSVSEVMIRVCTSVDSGAQGASNLKSLPSKSEDRRHEARDLSHELHHPGRVLLLTSPWDGMRNRLVDVPRGHPVMHELFLMKSMLMQHMLDSYSASLGEIHENPRYASREERS